MLEVDEKELQPPFELPDNHPPQPDPLPRPRLQLPGFFDEVLRTILLVVAVTALFDMAIPRSMVDGRSMQPTFQDGERLIVSRVNYLLGQPGRGDIIVFNTMEPERYPNTMLIKRVIGLPGETVELNDGQVFIDGTLLEEDYTLEECRRLDCRSGSWTLAEDEYFIMGDNRNASRDSRVFGPVTTDHIVGEVLLRYWPPARWDMIAD